MNTYDDDDNYEDAYENKESFDAYEIEENIDDTLENDEDVEEILEDYRKKQPSRLTGPVLSTIFHIILFILMVVFLVFPQMRKEQEPEAHMIDEDIVEIEEPKEINEQIIEQKEETSSSSSSMPKIDTPRISTSDTSLDVEVESDVTMDTSGGFADGIEAGVGKGIGKGGKSKEKTVASLGGIKVNSKKLLVILDVSGSMTSYIPKLREEIAKNFKEAYLIEYNGCRLDRTLSDIMLTFLKHRKVDGIYWFSDLNDGINTKCLSEIEKYCLKLKASFYVRTVGHHAPYILETLVRQSKGKIKKEGDLQSKGTVFTTQYTYNESPIAMEKINAMEEKLLKKAIKDYIKSEAKEDTGIKIE